MGRRGNKSRNAVGLILKLRVIVAVQDRKNSFYMQILVLPTFGWYPLTPFALATAQIGNRYFFMMVKIDLAFVKFESHAVAMKSISKNIT